MFTIKFVLPEERRTVVLGLGVGVGVGVGVVLGTSHPPWKLTIPLC